MADDVLAKSPRCIVCGALVGAPESPMNQLHCLHCFCSVCVTDVFQPSGQYKCPIDDLEYSGLYTNEHLSALIQQYWSNSHTMYEPELREQLLQQLITFVNYQDVPCFNIATGCSTLGCPYIHAQTCLYQRYECPRRANCTRKATYCLFSHPEYPEFPVPTPLSFDPQTDSQTSFRYAQLQPSQLQDGVVLNPSLAMTSQRVTHTEVSPETFFFNTIQRRVEADSGYVYIQSLSLYKYLTNNSSSELDSLLDKYCAHAQMKTLKIIRKKSINWSYLSSDSSRRHFNVQTSQLLEKALKDGVEEIAIAENVTVNLRLMVKIHSGAVYTPVFRKETTTSTSHAAVMELITAAEKYDAISKEIQLLEQSLLIPEDTPGEVVEGVIAEFGLAVNQEGWLKGVKTDLFHASKRLHAYVAPEKISHLKLKPGANLDLLRDIIKQHGLIQLNCLLIGREPDLRHVRDDDLAIEHPQLPVDARKAVCSKFGIREVAGKWFGRFEVLSDALAEVLEYKEQLPQNASAEDIQWIVETFQVRVEDRTIIGQRGAVKEAIEKLLKKQLGGTDGGIPLLAEMPKNGFETWYFTQKENCKLVELDPRGPDYASVLDKIEQHLKHSVISIRRIYNKKQYLSYKLKLNKLHDETRDKVNESDLFYSSHRYNPEEMAQSEDGFKFKFACGSWGTGFYFSELAEKALETAPQSQTMPKISYIFLCTVITGHACFLKANKSLRRPPPPPSGEKPYQSVVGNGRGSTMWVVFEPDMARLKYLISFSTGKASSD